MSQISRYPVSKIVYERILEIFFGIIVRIRTKKEAERFLSDFLTPTERVMLAKRLAIAFLLERNYDQRTIARVLRVSTTTVSRVSLMKKIGGSGYEKMIRKLMRDEKLEQFLLGVAKAIASAASVGSKGTRGWRYLRQEIEKEINKKPF